MLASAKILSNQAYDVVVIGGGVVGCAVCRELSRYKLDLLLLEKENDVAEGISKANSGVIHAGFNVRPGSLKARTNAAGLKMIYELASILNVPHRRTGKLVVALTETDKPKLEQLKAQGEKNGTPGLKIIDSRDIKKIAPYVNASWALYSSFTGIISPYELTIALAENAMMNGARILIGTPVEAVETENGFYILRTPKAVFRARWVVNAAGLYAAELAGMADAGEYQIFPCRGQYLVSDKDSSIKINLPIYPVPPSEEPGLGIHITPTLEGNILLGPSAEFVGDKNDVSTSASVIEELKNQAQQLVPAISKFNFIRSYSGVRPKLSKPANPTGFEDFVIEESQTKERWINLIGIESPGLTASPAIARLVREIIEAKEILKKKPDFNPERHRRLRFAEVDDRERARRVAKDPEEGEVVCRCEHVTRAEVRRACRNLVEAKTLDAIKRRTRCGMGRCQGGFCTPRLIEILMEEGVPVNEIRKRGRGSELFSGWLKK